MAKPRITFGGIELIANPEEVILKGPGIIKSREQYSGGLFKEFLGASFVLNDGELYVPKGSDNYPKNYFPGAGTDLWVLQRVLVHNLLYLANAQLMASNPETKNFTRDIFGRFGIAGDIYEGKL